VVKPDYAGGKAFVSDFVTAIVENQQRRLEQFYFQDGDFTDETEAADIQQLIMGQARLTFEETAHRLAGQLADKSVEVGDIVYSSEPSPVALVIKDAGESYAHVFVTLDVNGQKWVVRISDVVQTGQRWRLGSIFTTVDLGTETRDMVEIEVPAEEESGEVTEEKQPGS
jgi:hypothetical protein